MADDDLGDGDSLGTLYVDIEPRTRGFYQRTKAEVLPPADQLGREVGERVAGPIGQRIANAIHSGVKDGGRLAVASATKEGEQAGAAFGRTAKARIEAALRNIPDIDIDLDSSKAERKAARIRAELLALSRRIDIDIDDHADEHIERIRLLRNQLSSLAKEIEKERVAGTGTHRPIVIEVDAVRAHAELTQLGREVRQVQTEASRRVSVNVDDNSGAARSGLRALGNSASDAGRKVSLLVAVGALIGPAIVPGAAAAAGAILAIGAAAGGALAGIAVLGFGFSGVVGAVQALSQAQDSAGGSAGGYAGNQNQVADAVERVHDSERRLGEEQRTLVRVQEDVNRARVEAIDNLHRLADEAEGGALAERQAVIDLAEARDRLERENRAGTERARTQAQLDYDRAVFRLKTIREENARTAQDKAEADAKGVEGSDAVTAAQERVRTQTLAVEQAQRDLAKAQRDAASAAAAGAAGGGAGLDALKKKLDSYSPAMRHFAQFLLDLKPQLIGVRDSVQGAFLPGVERAITNLLPAVPALTRFLTGLGLTMGHLAAETTASLGSPVWRNFFDYVGRTAGPVITGLVHSVRNLSEGFVGMVTAFEPVSSRVGGGIVSLTAKFAAFGSTAGTNPAFQQFLAYVQTRGPEVVKTLGLVARAVLDIATATAPIGDVSLKILQGLANAIHAIPTPVLTVILGIIIATTTALKAYALATTISGIASKAWAAIQGGLGRVTEDYRTNLLNSVNASGQFNASMAAIQTGANTAKGAMGGLVSVLGGPWGVAIAAATAAAAIFLGGAAEQKERVEGLTSSLLQLGVAYKKTGDSGSKAVLDVIAQNKALGDLTLQTKSYGLSVDTVARAAAGEAAAQSQVYEALKRKRQLLLDEQAALAAAQAAAGNAGPRASFDDPSRQARIRQITEEQQGITDLTKAIEAELPQLKREAELEQLLAASSLQYASPAQEQLAQAQAVLASATASATEKLLAQHTVNDLLAQSARDASEAAEAYAAAEQGLTESIKANGTSLETNTVQGRANRDALESLIDAAHRTYEANLVQAKASKDVAGATAEATAKYYAQLSSLREQYRQLGLNTDKLDELIGIYGQVPAALETVLRVNGYNLAHEQLVQLGKDASFLNNMQELLRRGFEITPGGNVRFNDGHGHAQGGPIVGPGTATSDSVPAWLSTGEFVHRAAAVDYYGSRVMNAINQRLIPRQMLGYAEGGHVGKQLHDHRVPGYAEGGYVPRGVLVGAAAGARMPLGEQQWAAMAGKGEATRSYNFYPQGRTFSFEDFQHFMAAQDAVERVGRPG